MSNILYLSHGGGPLPLLGDAGHIEMVECLKKIPPVLKKPSAIVVISAHWEEQIVSITSGAKPQIIYDYYGFPKESYEIQYPCSGNPDLASKIESLFEGAGIKCKLDDQRGFDHGLFVPLKIMYPDADIPCVQVSLLKNLDPKEHVKIGEALSDLKNEDILIIGSGFSFHNMRAFFEPNTAQTQSMNEGFEEWLIETISSNTIQEPQRAQKLIHWQNAPHARYCHPREEHLLPLHVCYGVAQKACNQYFELNILGKKSSMYLW